MPILEDPCYITYVCMYRDIMWTSEHFSYDSHHMLVDLIDIGIGTKDAIYEARK